MTAWLDDGDVRLMHGDALEQLALMPSESVQCIATSPPFWGLRDYGVDGQIGLEETPDEWCARLVAVMREARRVLRSDGVAWIEVGDTYAGSWAGNSMRPTGGSQREGGPGFQPLDTRYAPRNGATPDGCKPKDLVGAPWLLAFALRADGWYLRSDTIWARPNPMPESVTDRPTKAHSYVFLLTKSARYYYDADAIREPHDETSGWARMRNAGSGALLDQSKREGKVLGRATDPQGGVNALNANGQHGHPAGRNARSVWTIPTQPTPWAHFATFPEALVERCIKAGTSEHGCCSECGAPWRRITEREFVQTQETNNATASPNGKARDIDRWPRGHNESTTLGWEPSCACVFETGSVFAPYTTVVPCVVLDPFMGSGTTALVARRLGRHAIGIELSAEYLAIAATRLQQLSLLGGAS